MSFERVSYRGTKGILYQTKQLVGWVEIMERGTTRISPWSLRILGYLVRTIHADERVELCRRWLTEDDN